VRVWRVDRLDERVKRIEDERRSEKEERRRASERRLQMWIYFAFALLWTEIVVTTVLAIVKHAH
jgi:hypothetical protein